MGAVGGFIEDVTGINMGGDSSSDKAIDAQTQAAKEANATQKYMYDQTREDNKPWLEAGKQALGGLQSNDFQRDFTMADFQADPGYQFRMSEGMKAIQNSAAARGGLNSGATAKALLNFGQNSASQEWANAYNRFNSDRDRRFNRLSSLAGIGQTANSTNAAAGQNYANQVSGNQIGLGNAIGSANIAQGNRAANLVGQGIQAGATIYGNKKDGGAIFSDARLKMSLRQVSEIDLREVRDRLRPYVFKYRDEAMGAGDWIGVMAQDLEQTKLGRECVFEDAQGNKKIDIEKAVSLFLATMAVA